VTAGFKINITINNGSDKTPQWLLDALPAGQKIDLLDPASNHSTFCQPIATALYWNPVYHQARLDLIAAAGAHLANNPAVQGFTASFANHHSNDWNVQDTVGIISCPACPQPSPTECGDVVVDQVQQCLTPAGLSKQCCKWARTFVTQQRQRSRIRHQAAYWRHKQHSGRDGSGSH